MVPDVASTGLRIARDRNGAKAVGGISESRLMSTAIYSKARKHVNMEG